MRRSIARARGPSDVDRFVHGMTVGTNALLEGKVARTALLATEGFTDIEELGRQARAELYRLCAGHPPPLVPPELRVAVPERCGPDGVLRGTGPRRAAAADRRRWPDSNRPPSACSGASAMSSTSVACGAALDSEIHVSLSNEAAGVFREYERCATTVVDAALSPLLRRYLERLAARAVEAGLPGPRSCCRAAAWLRRRRGEARIVDRALRSGRRRRGGRRRPQAGAPEAVCLDMGGTSSDVSVVSGGRVRQSGGREVAGRALAMPMVDVHTVGAGGGSIAWRDAGGALRVGPQSAGAVPGPACYGHGGEEPTVTDANLLLGNLDPTAAAGRRDRPRPTPRPSVPSRGSPRSWVSTSSRPAEGILRVANAEMAGAVRVMTVERGIDPRELALIAFGGAGPMHGAAVADELGMRRVLVPPASGVLSAVGHGGLRKARGSGRERAAHAATR